MSIAVGAAVGLVGLAVRGWAAGHIRKDKSPGRHRARTGSPAIRSISEASSSAWASSAAPGPGGASGFSPLYFVVFYLPVIAEERDRMRNLFPDAYPEYERRVPIFFPTLRGAAASEPPEMGRRACSAGTRNTGPGSERRIVWGLFILRGMIRRCARPNAWPESTGCSAGASRICGSSWRKSPTPTTPTPSCAPATPPASSTSTSSGRAGAVADQQRDHDPGRQMARDPSPPDAGRMLRAPQGRGLSDRRHPSGRGRRSPIRRSTTAGRRPSSSATRRRACRPPPGKGPTSGSRSRCSGWSRA